MLGTVVVPRVALSKAPPTWEGVGRGGPGLIRKGAGLLHSKSRQHCYLHSYISTKKKLLNKHR